MTDQQTISTVTTAVTGLAACTRILPHDLRRAAGALQSLEEQRRLRATDGADVGEQVSAVLRALLNAERALQVANVHLREASGALAVMGDQLEDAAVTR
ncbi:hypothetical protein ACGFU4_35880 [Streptomyces sp. NPDC048511]|uniref:hypothetical protein n=1 Tax=Streptomyces sp. NPDC048511 TaxID=3365562 RepID=UPI00371E0189